MRLALLARAFLLSKALVVRLCSRAAQDHASKTLPNFVSRALVCSYNQCHCLSTTRLATFVLSKSLMALFAFIFARCKVVPTAAVHALADSGGLRFVLVLDLFCSCAQGKKFSKKGDEAHFLEAAICESRHRSCWASAELRLESETK